jgi:hypothetical protein
MDSKRRTFAFVMFLVIMWLPGTIFSAEYYLFPESDYSIQLSKSESASSYTSNASVISRGSQSTPTATGDLSKYLWGNEVAEHVDIYNMTDMPSQVTSATISKVTVYAFAWVGNTSAQPYIWVSANAGNTVAVDQAITGSGSANGSWYYQEFTTDPATQAAWTLDGINGLKGYLCLYESNPNGYSAVVNAYYVKVEYTDTTSNNTGGGDLPVVGTLVYEESTAGFVNLELPNGGEVLMRARDFQNQVAALGIICGSMFFGILLKALL